MSLPKLKPRLFRFVSLPDEVWKVQLLPQRIPLPKDLLTPLSEGGFRYEKVYEFIRQYLEETTNFEDIDYYESALKMVEAGNKGLAAHKKQDFQEAIRHYDDALAVEPESWLCWYNKAFCLLQLGNLDRALEVLHSAIQVLGSEPRNYALFGDILVQKKKFLPAYGAYHQFLRQARQKGNYASVSFKLRYQLGLLEDLEPRLKKVHPWPFDGRCMCGATLSFPLKCPHSSETQPHVFKDVRWPRTTDWHLQEALECHQCKGTVDGVQCGECERHYHWSIGTLKTFHPVEELDSVSKHFFDFGTDSKIKSDLESVTQEVAFLLLEFRYKDALEVLTRSRALLFSFPLFHYRFVEVYKLLNREREVLEIYESLLSSRPDDVNSLYGLALLAPNPEVAAKLYQDLILKDRTFVPAYQGLADVLMEQGQFEEALDLLNRALDIDLTWFPLYRSLGLVHQSMGQENLAIHYRNVLKRNSPYFDDRNENAYLAFAGRLKAQGQYARSNQVLSSISEIAKAAIVNDEQRLQYELGFDPWLKVKRIRNLKDMGQEWMAEEILGQLTKTIETATFVDESGNADLRLNLLKTLIDEGLADEAETYIDARTAAVEEAMDPAAVDWLQSYKKDKEKMHFIHSGDRLLDRREVASFAVRTLAEVMLPAEDEKPVAKDAKTVTKPKREEKKQDRKNRTGVFIDAEGLLVVPSHGFEDVEELDVVTYDGLSVRAQVVCHLTRAPVLIAKAPPLSEGAYFHLDLNLVPVLKHEDQVMLVGQTKSGDYVGIETNIKHELLDHAGVRFLVVEHAIEEGHPGGVLLSGRGAVLGMVIHVELPNPDLQSRIALDSDELTRILSGIQDDYALLYRYSSCPSCGHHLKNNQDICSCGHQKDSK